MGCNRHEIAPTLPAPTSTRAAAAWLAGIAAAVGMVGFVAVAGRSHASRPAAPTDRQIAQRAVGTYFARLDGGRGDAFCAHSITSTTLRAEGGLGRCTASIDGYVKRMQRQSYALTLQSMHYLFTMLSDGINLHCIGTTPCQSWHYGTWASESYPDEVVWVTSTDPSLASSLGPRVVAVVDPRASSPRRLTLYYQAWDGRILRASWSTELGSWRGSVVDTHAGGPFISRVRVVTARRTAPNTMVALVSLRVGTSPRSWESFRLAREDGIWRADAWRRVAGPPAA